MFRNAELFWRKSSLMNGAWVRWFVFLLDVFRGKLKKMREAIGEEKMDKTKVWKEVNVELFIVE